MSYVALYRKWRPDTFDEVKGQDHIVTTLRNQVKHKRVGHAYLFCGTRGTGKTTMARLLAKAVNCEHPGEDGSPCNECENCRAITEGRAMNVIEIDGASNNGVDNIRQINKAVQYSPTQGNYLVYIIDEVHMLAAGSGAAFNALLKTLEEPPAYVIFILATTELHKIPVTIKSRCQRYDFHRITLETIADRLEDLLRRENVKATREAVEYVARAADGSMRDGLSILEQCIAFNLGEELTYDKVLETVGAADVDVYLRLFRAICEHNAGEAVEVIDEVIWQGRELSQVASEFLTFLRNVLMLKLSPDMQVELSTENKERLKTAGANVPPDRLLSFINVVQETMNKLPFASNKRILLEVCVIKLCTPEMRKDISAIEERMEVLEKELREKMANLQAGIQAGVPMAAPAQAAASEPEEVLTPSELSERVRENIKKAYPPAEYEDLMRLVKEWPIILSEVAHFEGRYLKAARVTPSDMEQTVNLTFENTEANRTALTYYDGEGDAKESSAKHIRDLEELVMRHIEKEVHIQLVRVTPGSVEDKHSKDYDLTKIKFDVKIED